MKKLRLIGFLYLLTFLSCIDLSYFEIFTPYIKFNSPPNNSLFYSYQSVKIEIEFTPKKLRFINLYIDDSLFKTYIPDSGVNKINEELRFPLGRHRLDAWAFYISNDSIDSINSSVEFEVKDYAIDELIAPVDGETLMTSMPKFIWKGLESIEKYWIQIDTSSNFVNPLIEESTLTKSEYISSVYFQTNKYFWRVRVGKRLYPYFWGILVKN